VNGTLTLSTEPTMSTELTAAVGRAAHALEDAALRACRAGPTDPRRHALLGHVRAAAGELARCLDAGGITRADVDATVRGLVTRAVSRSGCEPERAARLLDVIAPLLGPA
jgi:hypothetical protein